MSGRHTGLLSRHRECRDLDDLLTRVRSGQSEVLALRGEAGIGKSALLDYVAGNATGCRVARTAGVESEMELAFAGLHRLCAPMLGHLDHVPGPQREALSTAFGIVAGRPPDRFLIALAALSLLANVAEETPLVCLIDDAQWLDEASAQTLGFVARRLHADSVALLFAVRETGADRTLAGLPEVVVGGLADADADLLLTSVLPGPVDQEVRSRIVAEARGNPLALLDLPHGRTAVELCFGFDTTNAAPLAGRIEESYARRLEALPGPARSLMLIAAVEPVGDATLLWRAARQLGIPAEAASTARASGLIEIGSSVRFRHPLVRSAVCRAASAGEMRRAHGVLADITDAGRDPDRRAWHRAHAATGPDDDIAADLERSADRARARGGAGAAAAFLARAAELTSDPSRTAELALAAAQARHQSGAFDAALALLAMAEAGPLSRRQRAQADLVRARVASASSHGREAPGLLVRAARQLEPLDLETARDTYLEAFGAAFFSGRLARVGAREVAGAARRSARPAGTRASDLLLDGWSALLVDGPGKGVPVLRRAVAAFCADDAVTNQQSRHVLPFASVAAADLMDDVAWDVLSARHLRAARGSGTLSELPLALHSRVLVHVLSGQPAAASALIAESQTVGGVTGAKVWPYGAVVLSAWEGRDSEGGRLARSELTQLMNDGQGAAATFLHWADALVANAHGQYHDAVSAAARAIEGRDELGQRTWGMVELVEAASRNHMPELAAGVLDELSALTRASGTDWALGLETRSRALVSDDAGAEGCYREAIERLDRTRIRVEAARAHLVYGEWLRRRNRRLDAREELRVAHETFAAMGVQAFAERARRELAATGLTVRTRTDETATRLTDQESQIARLAGRGRTNPEIGAELFISPRTVEWHLRKIFTKLDVTSRRQLRRATAGG